MRGGRGVVDEGKGVEALVLRQGTRQGGVRVTPRHYRPPRSLYQRPEGGGLGTTVRTLPCRILVTLPEPCALSDIYCYIRLEVCIVQGLTAFPHVQTCIL